MTNHDRRQAMPVAPRAFPVGLRRPMVVTVIVLLSALGVAFSPTPARPRGLTSTPPPTYGYAWTQLGVDGVQIARVLTNADCPSLIANGGDLPMAVRVGSGSRYQENVCEAILPPGATTASLSHGPSSLPLLTEPPKRIAVVGDTGCRLNQYDGYQACNDPAAWPFASIAEQVAAWQPDLIIHVGDYLYREDACPPANSGCAGSPYGDNVATWRADFFDPAQPMLRAAPILFLRGNHEVCSRAGEGWFRYLDPRPMPNTCQDFTEPYAVSLGDLRLVVLDSASAGDEKSTPEETATYKAQFAQVAALVGDGAWLVTHKPVWGVIENKQGDQIEVRDESFEAATADELPASIQLLLAGHIHLAEVLVFDPDSGRPPQVIAGNGGTMLDRNVTRDLTGEELDDAALAAGQTLEQFGFLTLERTETGWEATQRDVAGQAGTTCLVGDGTATCEFAPPT